MIIWKLAGQLIGNWGLRDFVIQSSEATKAGNVFQTKLLNVFISAHPGCADTSNIAIHRALLCFYKCADNG